jgi:hypothetical protein
MNPQKVHKCPVCFVVCHPYLQASLVVDITTRLGELSVENYDGDVIAQFTPAAREEMEASTFGLIQSRILVSGTVRWLSSCFGAAAPLVVDTLVIYIYKFHNRAARRV